MANISTELKSNYEAFSGKLPDTLAVNVKSLRSEPKLVESYARVAALNAMKVELVDAHFSPSAAQLLIVTEN